MKIGFLIGRRYEKVNGMYFVQRGTREEFLLLLSNIRINLGEDNRGSVKLTRTSISAWHQRATDSIKVFNNEIDNNLQIICAPCFKGKDDA